MAKSKKISATLINDIKPAKLPALGDFFAVGNLYHRVTHIVQDSFGANYYRCEQLKTNALAVFVDPTFVKRTATRSTPVWNGVQVELMPNGSLPKTNAAKVIELGGAIKATDKEPSQKAVKALAEHLTKVASEQGCSALELYVVLAGELAKPASMPKASGKGKVSK